MRSVSRLFYLGVAAAVWAALAIYAARVTHDFYTHVDRAVYAAVDDGEANIAYELASHGRYAFPASPVLEGLSRMRGQFNYGPWYFYIAGALIWLFGYSLTLVRSIHLWVVVISIAAAIGWFRERGRVEAGGLFGFGLLFFFETAQWPMVRPDSLVTLCAVVMTIAAGRGLLRGRPGAWFVTGLAAACGALTHLIAASLLGSAAMLFAVFAWQERRSDPAIYANRIRPAALALAAGVLLGVLMFYASFGFDIREQWRFLSGYRAITATGETFVIALERHFHMAFGVLPPMMQRAVWLTLAVAWLTIAGAMASTQDRWRRVLAYVLPPALIWTLYFLSNGKYTNYHTGYAILHQAMFLWTAAALVFVACGDGAAPRGSPGVLSMLLAVLVLGQGVRQLRWQQTLPARETQAAHHVAFSEYVDRVIGNLPRHAVVWGSVIFGIESPDRIQLVQQDDAETLTARLAGPQRAAFIPDFLVWGYPELREEVLSGSTKAETRLAAMDRMFPGVHFRLVSLVEGAPYGVTRVYARVGASRGEPEAPAVAGYDDVNRQWRERVGPKLPAEFTAVDPVALRIGNETEPSARIPQATFAGDLPPGRYLVAVTVRPTAGTRHRLIAVTSSTMLRQTATELGPTPEGDFAPYVPDDREVFALSAHPGGPLYVSQFDGNEGAGITSVSVSPVLDLLNPSERAVRGRALPPLTRWIPMPGIQGILKGGRLHVDGDRSPASYQMYSPLIAAQPGDSVEADVPSAVARGRVCAGILNGRGQWIIPATKWRQQFDFVADGTGGFRIAFSNCQLPGETQATQIDVLPGSFATAAPPSYADGLVRVALEGTELNTVQRPVPPPVGFPEQPFVAVSPAEFTVRAAGVERGADSWNIIARTGVPYFLKSRSRYIDNETHLVVAGRIEHGGLIVGLLQGDEWAIRRTINEPGDFVVLLTPKDTGKYAVAVAGDSTSGADAAATLTRIDLVPPVRPAK